MLDVFSGLFFVATVTGLSYAKFARPTAKVMFSDKVLITPHRGSSALTIRLANGRHSYIVNARIKVAVMVPDDDESSLLSRRLIDLQLERAENPIFGLSWMVTHCIDEKSLLYGLSAEDILSKGIHLIITVEGMEESFGQTVQARRGYTPGQFVFNKRFVNIQRVAKCWISTFLTSWKI